MNGFLQELGRKLPDRWLTLLLLPGLLWCAAVLAGVVLGHAHAFDFGMYLAGLSSRSAAVHGSGIWVLIVVLALVASAAAMAARLAGAAVQRLWLGQWPWLTRPLLRLLVRRRLRRWEQAADAYAVAVRDKQDFVTLERLAGKRNAIALAPPVRPSWIGDRIAAVDARILASYELDLSSAWPRLWPLLSDALRADLRAAGAAFSAAATLSGWALLYVGVGFVWWPGFVIGLACLVASVSRARSCAATFADLIEASVDLHGPDLCAALHITESAQALTPEHGREVTMRLRKGA